MEGKINSAAVCVVNSKSFFMSPKLEPCLSYRHLREIELYVWSLEKSV